MRLFIRRQKAKDDTIHFKSLITLYTTLQLRPFPTAKSALYDNIQCVLSDINAAEPTQGLETNGFINAPASASAFMFH